MCLSEAGSRSIPKLARVKHLLQEFPNASGEGVLTPEQVRLYAQGWVLAEDSPNWTKYCFYGADIRREALAWLLAQVRVLAQTPMMAMSRAARRPSAATGCYALMTTKETCLWCGTSKMGQC